MSTINYDSEELANVALLVVAKPSSDDGKHALRNMCAALAEYSKANTAAYNARYADENQTPSTAGEIEADTKRVVFDPQTAVATARGLRYNLDAQATVEALHAVIDVLSSNRYAIFAADNS